MEDTIWLRRSLEADSEPFSFSDLIQFFNLPLREGLTYQDTSIQELCQNASIDSEALSLGEKYLKKKKPLSFEVGFIHEQVGFGLLTQNDLEIGTFLGEYSGVIRRNDMHFLTDYLYRYPAVDEIKRPLVIDAEHGGLMRFMNHSQTPNVKGVYAYYDGMYHVVFVTIQKVAKGTQLCYDYGSNYWNLRTKPRAI